MSVSHAALSSATTPAIEELLDYLSQRRQSGEPTGDLSTFERDLHQRVMAVEREAIAEEIARYDLDLPEVIIAGQPHRRVLREPGRYQTGSGEVRVYRSLYRGQAGERALCPMELRAGLIQGRWTPRAAQQALFTVALLPPRQTAQLLDYIGNMTPSTASLDRLPKAISTVWEEQREVFEAALREAESVPPEAVVVAVSLDGVLVPMVEGKGKEKREAAEKAGKKKRGPNGYREVGCGTVTLYDSAGNRLLTRRLARMPESKKKGLKASLKSEVAHLLGLSPLLKVVKLADGAKDNWTFLSRELPGEDESLDFYHATSHLHEALVSAYGEGSAEYYRQFYRLRHKLLEAVRGVEKVIRSLRYLHKKHPRREKILKELKYFRRNRHRMKYAEQTAKGHPIGSGVVEAACKTLASLRMKGAGMRWGPAGGQAVLTLRSLIQSDRFDRAWAMIRHLYTVDVLPPQGVIPFPMSTT